MSTSRLVARVKSSESPAVWLLAVAACRGARLVSRHPSRWTFRLGYALEQLDRARAARRDEALHRVRRPRRTGAPPEVVRLLGEGRAQERAGHPAEAAAAYRRALEHPGAASARLAYWWYRLGFCLRATDHEQALAALRRACADPAAEAHWYALLADLEAQVGSPAAAVAAAERAVALGGATDPVFAVGLADLYDRAGRWDDARRLMAETVAGHPRYAAGWHRLGTAALAVARWGGTLTGALTDAADAAGTGERAGFVPDPDPAATRRQAREALEQAVRLAPGRTAWRLDLAEARTADGDVAGAAEIYEAALRQAEDSPGRWVLVVKQRMQFALESAHHRLGRPRVEDPLFDCTFDPAGPADPASGSAGVFDLRPTFGGVMVSGVLATGGHQRVDILLDGLLLRSVNLDPLERWAPRFQYEIKRAALERFPQRCRIEVRVPDGPALRAPGGAVGVDAVVPHGDGSILQALAGGGTLDKKGFPRPTPEELRRRQDRFLELYATVADFFEKKLGRPLLLMYGTLLGFYRDGDFIPGDDDFDCGYISDRTDPVSVKEETKDIIVELIRAGFTVSFNRRGRLFRVQTERTGQDGLHLDVRPLWFQDGRVWLHNHCSFPATRDDFLPPEEGSFRGVRVLIPHRTEVFLRGHYGPGWKVPDPGFTYYLSDIDPAILDNLAKALITVREYRELAARIRREVGDDPSAGRFVSVGSQDLYPLDQFLP